jgi:hypothetical protein
MIKSWKLFNEEISGTEYTTELGLAPSSTSDITPLGIILIHSDITDVIYTIDQYEQLYNEYLKIGGQPLFDFNKANLEIVLTKLAEVTP